MPLSLHMLDNMFGPQMKYSKVWHPMLTQENVVDIERVQKSALKVNLKEDYNTYEEDAIFY